MFFGSLFLWYVRLGKYHRVIVFLMLHGILDAYDDVRVEELGFEDSNPRTGKYIWRPTLDFSFHIRIRFNMARVRKP